MQSVLIALAKGSDEEAVLRSLEEHGLQNVKIRMNIIIGDIEGEKMDSLKNINGVEIVEINRPLNLI